MRKYIVTTQHPIAFDSKDHQFPHGTMNDNSRWHAFNEKLYRLFPSKSISVMDFGCAGGGFVKDCLDDGHQAIGLEGSDFNVLSKRAEWATIPDNLFTCDVTKPFMVQSWDTKLFETPPFASEWFDVITAWEVMEHIAEEDLPQMLKNCDNHLKKDGYLIFSVSMNPQFWHVCVHDRDWWLNMFEKNGWVNRQDLVEYFGDDWIRGPKQGAPNTFHVVLQRKTV